MASAFIPRARFPTMDSLPRSYFLGHHRAGLTKMKQLLASTDLIIECRDYRVPLTSRNPLFEASLGGRPRLIVYTKKDLGTVGPGPGQQERERERIIRGWHASAGTPVLFSDAKDRADVRRISRFAATFAARSTLSITGLRMMVVGMPNVGKSTLLNALRYVGTGRGKAAITGAQPGVTRKIATGVKIIDGNEAGGGGGGGGGNSVYLLDTPGVFIPYVPDAEAMLKLSLCGSVKDTIISPTMLADYLLYHLNLVSPGLYAEYHPPTNDVMELLAAVARRTGRLQKGGAPDAEAAALWLIQRWRAGHLGRFVLDPVTEEAWARYQAADEALLPSLNQARKAGKAAGKKNARRAARTQGEGDV